MTFYSRTHCLNLRSQMGSTLNFKTLIEMFHTDKTLFLINIAFLFVNANQLKNKTEEPQQSNWRKLKFYAMTFYSRRHCLTLRSQMGSTLRNNWKTLIEMQGTDKTLFLINIAFEFVNANQLKNKTEEPQQSNWRKLKFYAMTFYSRGYCLTLRSQMGSTLRNNFKTLIEMEGTDKTLFLIDITFVFVNANQLKN